MDRFCAAHRRRHRHALGGLRGCRPQPGKSAARTSCGVCGGHSVISIPPTQGPSTVFGITPSARLRPSPYFEATLAEGVTAFTIYNHMLMPTSFGKPEEEYWRLIQGVSQWDVACERQVELCGPDAGRLAQILTVRDLRRCAVGQ